MKRSVVTSLTHSASGRLVRQLAALAAITALLTACQDKGPQDVSSSTVSAIGAALGAGCEGSNLECDDGNSCTDDACVEGLCVNTPKLPGVQCTDACEFGGAKALGAATEFNLVTFGDFQGMTSDIEGRAAVQGNATLQSYSVGTALAAPAGLVFAVGGDLDWSDGQVNAGDGIVGGGCTLTNVQAPSGTLTCDTPPPIDFAAMEAQLAAFSTYLAGLPANGDVSLNGELVLTATGPLSVFSVNLSNAQLAAINGFRLVGSADTTMVINVTGDVTHTITNAGFFLDGGITPSTVIWNFVSTESLIIENMGVKGSILAVGAALTFNSAHVDGQVLVASAGGGGEYHNFPFRGNVCEPAPGGQCGEPTCDETGQCTQPESCDDNDPCTVDSCDPETGACTNTPVVCEPSGNVCTPNVCNPDTGQCELEVYDGSCFDGDPCTIDDRCREGVCSGEPKCVDDNECTDDVCDPDTAECSFPFNEAPCDDGERCTDDDRCSGGECVGGPEPDCSDGNECTVDSCDPIDGCVHVNQPIDCELDDWGPWGECSATCGGGTQTRTRAVLTEPSCGGAACGETTQTRSCNDDPCPVDCVVSEWSLWSECEGDCSGGIQTRTRTVVTPPANGGQECPHLREQRDCSMEGMPCNDGVDCTTDDLCDAGTCTGTPNNGLCGDNNSCTEDVCHPVDGCINTNQPVDCQLGDWGPWGECSAACGGGTRTRTRDVVVSPSCGGDECEETSQTEACNEQSCPTDCVVSEWSQWSACEGDCSGGIQTRTRTIITPPQHGGEECPHLREERECSVDDDTPCDDDNACTINDRCQDGECVGTVDCDDDNPCTADRCEDNGCAHEPIEGPCDDGDQCNDTCSNFGEGVEQAWQVLNTHGGAGPYGVWISGFFDGVETHFVKFSFLDDGLFLWHTGGLARMSGTVMLTDADGGPGNVGDLWYLMADYVYRGQGQDGVGSGGPKVVGAELSVAEDWHYFDMVNAVMVSLADDGDYAEFTQRPADSVHPFQVGASANQKSATFGGSGWFDWHHDNGPGVADAGYGDIFVDFVSFECTPDVCVDGQCVGSGEAVCSDGDPCTIDSCDPDSGCFWTAGECPLP